MSDLYLIAHSVRGEAAFDVALQMECPHCMPVEPSADFLPIPEEGCFECEGNGYWWIIPTSGHRAYPYWSLPLGALMHDTAESFPLIDPERTLDLVPVMPPAWPDHYRTRAAPKLDITSLFKPVPKAHIVRRL